MKQELQAQLVAQSTYRVIKVGGACLLARPFSRVLKGWHWKQGQQSQATAEIQQKDENLNRQWQYA